MTMDLSIPALRAAYLDGTLTPEQVLAEVARRCDACPDPAVWITRLTAEQIRPYLAALAGRDPRELPLYGVPFAIKDNIDLAGVPTTAACPDYAYQTERSAFVVERLIAAGAIPIGKTNLDQFATGLVGTRSPYGVPRCVFDERYIAGGSSSGSAVAVARGLVSFSLGTDTAGSGRVPAAFNGLVGIKPTRGLLSNTGVVPACRTLDCVSIFAADVAGAWTVLRESAVYEPEDSFARPVQAGPAAVPAFRFGVPDRGSLTFFGNAGYAELFAQAAEHLADLGGTPVEIDLQPFLDTARLLYQGPWVAERYAAIAELIEAQPEALHPVTRVIIGPARQADAVAAFQAQYCLAGLRRRAEQVIEGLDFVIAPTAGTHYRVDEVEADPLALNTNLGRYTNFMNLLDLSAIAVPTGMTSTGLPFGVTLFAPAFRDRALAGYAARLHAASGAGSPSPTPFDPEPLPGEALSRIAVCGAHMEGLPLNGQLTGRGGRLIRRTRSAPVYRLYALPGGPPHRPGMVRVTESGAPIEVEVWELPTPRLGDFLALVPAPLAIGTVELEDGQRLPGFVCEAYAASGAEDITRLGGWRAYLAQAGNG
jgi:allophanate hydrolase